MVLGEEDLGLSLSLAFTHPTTSTTTGVDINHHETPHMNFFVMNPNNTNIHPQTTSSYNNNNNNIINKNNTSSPLELNLMISPFYSSTSTPNDRSADTCRSFPRGIDVNRSTRGGGDEEDAGVSSPNSAVSTVSGKRSSGERDSGGGGDEDEAEVERASSRGMSDEEDGGENCRKKLRLTKDQSATLEESFKEHCNLNPKQKQALAKQLGLRPRQVEVWFQNRRARTKLKQTEVNCEFLKGCCEKLTDENRRLQKEVHELRSLKLSPQFYMHMTPPTTLTMCPSCERVVGPARPVNPWSRGLGLARPVEAAQLRL
ncbi:hypothetical protein RND81_06G226100 [Saponaria officinalis]|uniref:Homeobox domain-containing protein n=1 Tax=Saponaria officinalis TaxID=3572 RepID=A0AAW1KDV5_SAPOF